MTNIKRGFKFHIKEMEDRAKQAREKHQDKLASVLDMLVEDAKKWQQECEEGRLNYTDTLVEICCLKSFAHQAIIAGERLCNPEHIKSYLTH